MSWWSKLSKWTQWILNATIWDSKGWVGKKLVMIWSRTTLRKSLGGIMSKLSIFLTKIVSGICVVLLVTGTILPGSIGLPTRRPSFWNFVKTRKKVKHKNWRSFRIDWFFASYIMLFPIFCFFATLNYRRKGLFYNE